MSGQPSPTTPYVAATDGSSGRKLMVDAADVAWQSNADVDLNALLERGCLKLGDDDINQDNNNVELQPRQRFTSWLYDLVSQRVGNN